MTFLDYLVATSAALVIILGLFIGVIGSMVRGYKEARARGDEPLLHAIYSGFVGFFTSAVIITLLFVFLEFVGFKVRYYVCSFFVDNKCHCAVKYGNEEVEGCGSLWFYQ